MVATGVIGGRYWCVGRLLSDRGAWNMIDGSNIIIIWPLFFIVSLYLLKFLLSQIKSSSAAISTTCNNLISTA